MRMSKLKRSLLLLLRLAMAFIVMFVAYILSTMVIGGTNVVLTPKETSQASTALRTDPSSSIPPALSIVYR
jgi:phosphoglycerol transferase MdoB-like AlkP superfamily enzyme